VANAIVDVVEQQLRRLALNDEKLVASVLAAGPAASPEPLLDRKTEALVRVGALLAVGASTASLRWTVEVAQAAGATDEEVLGVLIAIGPAVGLARVVAQAPRLALAMGYEIDDEG
jgi:alkylhydroperoxidase/carboxymuconolactone decarboxylase family protein YurZ